MLLRRLLLDPQGGEGNGQGEGTPKPAEQGGDKGADLVKAVEGLISRHGDPTAALRVLMGENYTLRDKVRETEKRLAPDGALILTGDDAKRWGTYRELGEPSDLKKALGERDEYRTKADGFERRDFHAEVAAVSGFKPSVLSTLIDRDKLAVEVIEEKGKDGKAVPVAVVKGDGDQSTKLADYAAANWAEFLPALAVVADPKKPNGTPGIARPRITPTTGQGSGQAEKRRIPTSSW